MYIFTWANIGHAKEIRGGLIHSWIKKEKLEVPELPETEVNDDIVEVPVPPKVGILSFKFSLTPITKMTKKVKSWAIFKI